MVLKTEAKPLRRELPEMAITQPPGNSAFSGGFLLSEGGRTGEKHAAICPAFN